MSALPVTRDRDRPRAPSLGAAVPLIDPSLLLGRWVNFDKPSRGVRELVLAQSKEGLTVRIFGVSPGAPIDWGESPAAPFTDGVDLQAAVGFSAHYDFGYLRTLVAAYLNKRLLVVDTYNTFHDDTGRSSYFSRDHFYIP
jgi:hypothetical protein